MVFFGLRQTYLEKVGFDLPTVLAHLLFDGGVKQVFGRNSRICHSLVVTEQPNEDVRDGVLRLGVEGYDRIGWNLMDVLLELTYLKRTLLLHQTMKVVNHLYK